MGLKVEKVTPHGVSVNYARIRRVSVDADSGRVDALLAYYLSEESRLAGMQPVWYEDVSFPLDALPEDFRAAAYVYITNSNVPQVGLSGGPPLVLGVSEPSPGPDIINQPPVG